VLAVQGTVVPATSADVRLWAELEDGRRIEGESQIGHAPSPIVRLGCTPERPPAIPRALEAIANADLIVLGPGSLYTSLLPNLLVPELVQAISRSKAPRLYICNLMTQPGETDGAGCGGAPAGDRSAARQPWSAVNACSAPCSPRRTWVIRRW